MASFSFRHPFRSIGKIIREIVIGPERKKPEPPPTPPPPPVPPGPPPPGPTPPPNTGFNDRRYEIWEDVTNVHDRNTAEEWWDLYLDTGIWVSRTYAETNRGWRDFLRAFWLNSSEPDSYAREDFYDEYDTPKTLIDWDRWRVMKKTP